jgi:glycerophosphoryl diester phosphodiesterase
VLDYQLQRAIDEGADFIETDITATKDGRLICFHDLILDDTTDVADHAEFRDRIHTYEDEGKNVTGYFAVDFTLDELKTLRARQRFKFRDQSFNGKGCTILPCMHHTIQCYTAEIYTYKCV